MACSHKTNFEPEDEYNPLPGLETPYDDGSRMCSEYEREVMLKAGENDFAFVRKYLEEGGDPNLHCVCATMTLDNGKVYKGAEDHLHWQIIRGLPEDIFTEPMDSSSYDFLIYYLSFNLSEKVKSDYLSYFLGSNTAQTMLIERTLVEKGAIIEHLGGCVWENIEDYKRLGELGYDFNSPITKTGKTPLMIFAECPCDKIHNPAIYDTIDPNNESLKSQYNFKGYNTAAEIIEIMKVIIQYGGKTDLKDNNGKTALDLAVNPEIIAFLKSLEE